MFLQQAMPSKGKVVHVPADGDPKAKICIVGEAPGAYELSAGKPFVGPAGRVLEQCMHSAGLIRSEVYMTNLIKHKIKSIDKYYSERTKRLTAVGQEYADELLAEIESIDANIIVPMGNPATAALLGSGGIMQKRGYIYEGKGSRPYKVLPAIHPAAALRGNYIYRYYIVADFQKVKKHQYSTQPNWPDVYIDIPRTYEQARYMLTSIKNVTYVSVDIEVANFEVSCIGFCTKPNHAYVIPMYGENLWTLDEEIALWTDIAEIMGDPSINKIGQNFIFDMQFLAIRNNIITRGYIHDTMIKQSLVYPDFSKSLEFLTSVYCNRPYWKDMVKWKGNDLVKKES